MGLAVRELGHRPSGSGGGVNGVSFEHEGGPLAVLGPPGSGKGTLLSLLAGAVKPMRGSVWNNGQAVETRFGGKSSSTGYVPLGAGLIPGMSVAESFDFYLLLRQVHHPEERRQRITSTLERLGLQGAAEGPTSTIPPSIAFVVTIAQALLLEPEALIVHEPSGLTQEARSYARAVLRNYAASKTVVLASEEPPGLEQFAARVCVLEAGRQRFFGKPSELAATALGHTWETTLRAGEEPSFVFGFVATREDATPEGRRIRGVAYSAPSPQATPAAPEFFDGYTWCLATDEANVRAGSLAAAIAAPETVRATAGGV